jgi:glutamate/aspartate transport system substrate-binding protein
MSLISQSVRGVLVVVALVLSASGNADTLTKIKTSGEFVLGHRESTVPFSYIDGANGPRGYSVELCLRVFERVKKELARNDLKLKYVALKPADRIPAVKENRVDVECGSTTNTVARQKDAAFSYTMFVAGARFVAKKSLNLKDANSLRGKRVAVSGGTTTEKLLNQYIGERNLGIQVVTVKETVDAFKAVESGAVEAALGDDAIMVGLAARTTDPGAFEFIGKYLSVEPYGIMFRKDDAAFARLVDTTLADLFASGQINTIYSKWFEAGQFKLPMNQYMKENVRLPNKFGVQ